jgi:hypothetical protein
MCVKEFFDNFVVCFNDNCCVFFHYIGDDSFVPVECELIDISCLFSVRRYAYRCHGQIRS